MPDQRSRYRVPGNTALISRAARQVLSAFARLFCGCLPFGAAKEMLEEAYLEVAIEQGTAIDDSRRAPSNSTISLISGLESRRVSSIHSRDSDCTYGATELSSELKLLRHWKKNLVDQRGKPLALETGASSTPLSRLCVVILGRNITPSSLYRRCEASGAVSLDRGLMTLHHTNYFPVSKDQIQRIAELAGQIDSMVPDEPRAMDYPESDR
jgi:hypothetical protein